MKHVLIVMMSLSFWNCQDVKRPEIPENLISTEKMVDIFTEVYLVNAARSFDNRTIIDKNIKLDTYIYNKFSIDSLQFVQSNAYYTSNLNVYNSIFLQVEERMTHQKKVVDSLIVIYVKEKKEERRIEDSINGIKPDTIKVVNRDTVRLDSRLIDPQSTSQN